MKILTFDSNTHITFDESIVGPWVHSRFGATYTPGHASAIGRVKDGKLIAGVTYENYNGANVFCSIAGEGNWANKRFLWLIFDYPFNQLNCRRITTTVNPGNVESQKFTEKLGFDVECKLKDAHPEGDMWVFRMFKENCRWIKK